MNPNDKILFDFFYELEGILNYKDEGIPGNHCQTVFEQATKILEEKTYSDINVQGRHKDTFLHLVFQSVKYRPHNMKYAFLLMSLGANPFIKNIDHCNAFQKCDLNILAQKFWTSVDNYTYSNFKEKTNGYCTELKQSIFDKLLTKPCSLNNISDIKSFLLETDLYSNKNYAKILCYAANIHISSSIAEFISCKPTPRENSTFLYHLLNKFFFSFNDVLARNAVINFVVNTKFEINGDILSTLYDSRIHKDYQQGNTTGEAATFIIDHLVNLVVDNDLDNQLDMNKKYKINFSLSSTFNDVLNNDLLKKTYLYLKLNKNIPMKENVYIKKIKI